MRWKNSRVGKIVGQPVKSAQCCVQICHRHREGLKAGKSQCPTTTACAKRLQCYQEIQPSTKAQFGDVKLIYKPRGKVISVQENMTRFVHAVL